MSLVGSVCAKYATCMQWGMRSTWSLSALPCNVSRDKYPGLFQVNTMRQFMWQADIIGVANFIKDCFAHVHAPVDVSGSDDESI